jgi:hypothetical protein
MKYIYAVAVAGALVGLVGCASAPTVVVNGPVGPRPGQAAGGTEKGSLVIYSAPRLAPVDVNEAEWRWNNDYGKNPFLYEPAHTDYTIYSKDGQVLKHVRNAQAPDDSTPTVVTLPAGSYKVEAEAVSCDGSRVQALMAVVIEPQATTVAHLADHWKPMGQSTATEVAKLPCGKAVGWRAPEAGYASTEPNR